MQFNETQELYNALLRQINSTLSRLNDSGSGVGSGEQDDLISPQLLEQLQNYQVMLEKLLERAKNATERYNIIFSKINGRFSHRFPESIATYALITCRMQFPVCTLPIMLLLP